MTIGLATVSAFVVDLPLPVKALSPNAHLHWREKHKATSAARKNSWYWFRRFMPNGWKPAPIEIAVQYRWGPSAQGYRPRDVQNAIAALKPMIDGMVDAGIIPDDSAKWLSWGRVQIVRCALGDVPGVRITVAKT